jgi:Glyoxalase-like domain
MATQLQVVIDCARPGALSEFWAAALGYKIQDPPAGYNTWEDFHTAQGIPQSQFDSASAVVDPDGVGPRIYFQRVPEHKSVKNRVHLDLNVGGGRDAPADERVARVRAEVHRLTGLGATALDEVEESGEFHIVMRDPEGNEFCVQ